MDDFKPFGDESTVLGIGNLDIENQVDRVTLHGDVVLTRDRQGLALAKQLKAALDAVVKTLEADKRLPDAVEVKPAKTVKNPLA